MNKTTTRKLGLAAVSVVVSVALLELVLRLVGFGEWVPIIDVDDHASREIESGWLREDRTLFWRIGECDDYCRNIKHVHPDNPAVASDPGGKNRIICIGDSCTFLADAEQNHPPYPVALEGVLADPQVEVLSAAVPGYSSQQGRVWLEAELLDYRPKLVVVYFGWNDHWRSHGVTDREYAERLTLPALRIARLWNAMFGGNASMPGAKPLRVPLADYVDNLRGMHRVLSSAGIESVFVTAPAVAVPEARERLIAAKHLDPADDYMALHRSYNDALRGLAGEELRVLDLAARFRAHPTPQSLMKNDGIHLSAAGIALTASALRELIVAQRLLE